MNRSSIFQLNYHVERLHTASIERSQKGEEPYDNIKEIMLRHVQIYLQNITTGDVFVNFFLSYADNSITSHGEPLPTRPLVAPLLTYQMSRPTPRIKDISWAHQRQEAEKLLGEVVEVILYDEDGTVTEGLSSNVFALMPDGKLYTAPTGLVLAGSVRGAVLEVCKELGI